MKMDSLQRTSGACVVLKEDAFSFLSYFFFIFLTKSLQAVATCNNHRQQCYTLQMKFFPNERQSMNLTLCIHLVPMQITGKWLKKGGKK
jgi:hypothetical protein